MFLVFNATRIIPICSCSTVWPEGVRNCLSRSRPGGELSVLGPLGRGFTLPTGIRRVIFIAGGVGVAPLTFLLHSGLLSSGAEPEIRKNFYLGARSAELLAGLDRLEGYCELGICTDDGSRGYHGPVTAMFESGIELLKRDIGGYNPEETMIYACGPTAMIRAIGTSAQRESHPLPGFPRRADGVRSRCLPGMCGSDPRRSGEEGLSASLPGRSGVRFAGDSLCLSRRHVEGKGNG